MSSAAKRVLISGAGVAGPALAWWLSRLGFAPTIVEIAPRFRTGGYMIDFWGKGFDLIEEMGLLPQVREAGYRIREVRFLDSEGNRAGGFSTAPFWNSTGGRFTSLPRSELAKVIWNSLPASVSTRFGDEIRNLRQGRERVEVQFASGDSDSFDLVIGADGLHSLVRELVFGPEERFEKFLGYDFAAATVTGYEPRDDDVYMMHGKPGRQVARVSMRDDRTLLLFIWVADRSNRLPHDPAGQRRLVRERFAGCGWECPRMLDAIERSDDLYVDRMSQIHLPRWSEGRIGLVGDAAWAPSFLAGEGTGLGIIGAYTLAVELARTGGDPSAFASYERRLRGFMEGKQKMASNMGGAFVPKTALGVWLRNHIASLFNIGPIARIGLASTLKDKVDLPKPTAEQAAG